MYYLQLAIAHPGHIDSWSVSPITQWWYVYLSITALVIGLIKPVRRGIRNFLNTITLWLMNDALSKRDRRVDDIITRQTTISQLVEEIHEALLGPAATELMPDPSPGLIERIDVVEKNQKIMTDKITQAVKVANSNAKIVQAIAAEVKKQAPNGGDTNNTGDLILRLAKERGVVLEDPAPPHDRP